MGIGILDHADPQLAEYCDEFDWIGIGGIGRAMRLCKRWGAREAIMAGKSSQSHVLPTALVVASSARLEMHQDILSSTLAWEVPTAKTIRCLSTLVKAFADEGIDFQSIADFAPELLVQRRTYRG